jgi:hypothetical protein
MVFSLLMQQILKKIKLFEEFLIQIINDPENAVYFAVFQASFDREIFRLYEIDCIFLCPVTIIKYLFNFQLLFAQIMLKLFL